MEFLIGMRCDQLKSDDAKWVRFVVAKSYFPDTATRCGASTESVAGLLAFLA